MSMETPDHREPYDEAEYLALGETSQRIELFDGSLWVSPAPTAPHQDISLRLAMVLVSAADEAGLWVRQDINLRLRTNRIMQPDLVISRGSRVVSVTEAADALLVCEITSPSNAYTDRMIKRQLYAEARIPWYLLIEPELTKYESVTLHLFRLTANGYTAQAVAHGDETLTMDEPLAVKIEPNRLLGTRR